MINKERVQLLVDALRSGEYTQGFGYLEQVDDGVTRHCCLGVACRVAMKHGLQLTIMRHQPVPEGPMVTSFTGMEGTPPDKVTDWFGFEGNDPTFYLTLPPLDPEEGSEEIKQQVCATSLNDEWKWSFEQIADVFENRYLTGEGQ